MGYTFSDPIALLDVKGGAPAHLLMHSSGTLISVYGYREAPFDKRDPISMLRARSILKEEMGCASIVHAHTRFTANLAKSISIEANELLECFQWSDVDYEIEDVKEELADVLSYCIQMASKLDLDIKEIVLQKMEKTAKKYPVEKAKGVSTKYDKL